MSESVSWEGHPFWQQLNSCDGRFSKLQVSLSRRNIFAREAHEIGDAVQAGDIIPIPSIPLNELLSYSGSQDALLPGQLYPRSPIKSVEELLSPAPRSLLPTTPRSPLDRRIAELAASLGSDGTSRIAASPRILANLRPELPPQSSLLTVETGIARLPNEITKKIINLIPSRGDICALSCVSKRWRIETMPVLYSTLVLRGWDEVVVCLRSLCSAKYLADWVNDLTVDAPYVPEPLSDVFYATLENALDKTRNLRRLVLALNNDKKYSILVSCALAQCRFRLHHFVYNGPEATAEFFDFQSSIRTLQISYAKSNHEIYKAPASLPPHVTQLWVSLAHDTFRPDLSDEIKHISHLSYRSDSMMPLQQLARPGIHYLAFDVSAWLSSGLAGPLSFSSSTFRLGALSGLRILRLVGYCVICETLAAGDILPVAVQLPTFPVDPFGDADPAMQQHMATESDERFNIGHFLSEGNLDELESAAAQNILLERGLLTLLSSLPKLQALEVGSFVVRDAGRYRARPGYGRYWLAQRTRWEEEFVHRVTSRAATQLVVLSFLAYDEPLYASGFTFSISPRRWYDHIEAVKRQVAQDEETSGITLPKLIIQAGVTPWHGCPEEPDNKCDYQLNSARARLSSSRLLVEEVVTNEWVKAGPGGSWIKRVNVRNLRDIWPVGC
ncbi:PHO85 cyclin-1 [Ceratobasidium sp. AG-Ba]|nr:PHO85 cyclin-1 [Ceratobasidium sp. AG-Ba]